MSFSGHFMTIFRSNYFHLKNFFYFFFKIFIKYIQHQKQGKKLWFTDDEDKVHVISPVPRESPFRLPVKKRKVGTYRHTHKKNSTPWVAGLNCEYKLMLENNAWLCSEIINTCMKIIAKQFPHTPISGFQPTGLVPYFDEHTQCWQV